MADKEEKPVEEQTDEKSVKADEKSKKKDAKPAKKVKQKKKDDGIYLPVLVEFTFTSAVIFLILVFLAMVLVSWFTGTPLLDFVLRTSAAMGVLGGLLIVVSRQVSTGVLNASLEELENEAEESVSDEAVSSEQSEQLLEQVEQSEQEENAKNMKEYLVPEVQ